MLPAAENQPVAAVEAEIRCAAALAHRIFVAEIWPVVEKLAAQDQSRIAGR